METIFLCLRRPFRFVLRVRAGNRNVKEILGNMDHYLGFSDSGVWGTLLSWDNSVGPIRSEHKLNDKHCRFREYHPVLTEDECQDHKGMMKWEIRNIWASIRGWSPEVLEVVPEVFLPLRTDEVAPHAVVYVRSYQAHQHREHKTKPASFNITYICN